MAIGAVFALGMLSADAEPYDFGFGAPGGFSPPRRLSSRPHLPKTPPVASTPIKGPLTIAVSIASQHLTVYDEGVAIAHAPVSTGMAGHSTPMGVFSVIQKERFHRSNIYSGAPMPFMQRITWSGVALHAGVLPGYPASHGCIRMPQDFAVKLYGMTRVGARVVITRNDVTPVEIEHARLALLKKGDALSRTGDLRPAGEAPEPARERIKTADASSAAGPAMFDVPRASEPADAAPAVHAAMEDPLAAETRLVAAAPTGEAAPAIATAEPAQVPQPGNGAGPTIPPPHDSARPAGSAMHPATAGAFGTSGPDTGSAAATVAAVETTATIKPATLVLPGAAPESTSVSEPDTNPAALSLDEVFVPPARPARPLRTGPVSVFVSRKEGKLYVRKGFDPLFSAPVSIVHPEQPIGTHLFTAAELKSDGASMRWIALSIPTPATNAGETAAETRPTSGKGARNAKRQDTATHPASPTAAEALDRIELPPEVARQISALMSVGGSLIISDQGLGEETGLETDFIVVTPTGQKSTRPARRGAPLAMPVRKSPRDSITVW